MYVSLDLENGNAFGEDAYIHRYMPLCMYVCIYIYLSRKGYFSRKKYVSIAHGLQSYIILWIILLLSYAFFTSALENKIRYYHCKRKGGKRKNMSTNVLSLLISDNNSDI